MKEINKSQIDEFLQNWEIDLRKERMRLLQTSIDLDKDELEKSKRSLKRNSLEYDIWWQFNNTIPKENPIELYKAYIKNKKENACKESLETINSIVEKIDSYSLTK